MAKNPYLLTKEERELALDLFAKGKPLPTVINFIARSKGVSKIDKQVRHHITQALRTVNPNSHLCSQKSLEEIHKRRAEKRRDRKRAKFNITNALLEALEISTIEAALDVAKAALENVDDPRKLKALIQAINLLEESDDFNDKSKSKNDGDPESARADANKTIEALSRIIEGRGGHTPDL